MTREELEQLLVGGLTQRVYGKLDIYSDYKRLELAVKQIDPKKHAVFNPYVREDKKIYKEGPPDPDNPGEKLPGELEKIVKVSRLPLALQKRIVQVAAAFLGTPEMQATPDGQQ